MSFQWTAFLSALFIPSLRAAVLICGILLLRRILGNRIPPAWRHAIWGLVPLQLLLIVSIPSSLSLFNVLPSKAGIVQHASPENAPVFSPPVEFYSVETEAKIPVFAEEFSVPAIPLEDGDLSRFLPRPAAEPVVSRASETPLSSWPGRLAGIWGIGALTMGIVCFRQVLRSRGWVRRGKPVSRESVLQLFEQCCRQMNIRTWLVLAESPAVRSPFLIGAIRPKLLLPREMLQSASENQLRAVFLHELAHLKRWDIWTGWLMTLMLIVHWFNPLLWIAIARMNADREEACDVMAMNTLDRSQQGEYAHSLLDIAQQFVCPNRAPGLVGISETAKFLTRRIEMLKHIGTWKLRWKALALLLVAVIGIATFTDAREKPEAPPAKTVEQLTAELEQLKAELEKLRNEKVRNANAEYGPTVEPSSGSGAWDPFPAQESEDSFFGTQEFPKKREAVRSVSPSVRTAVSPAKKAKSPHKDVENLKQLALALHSYHDVYRSLPSASTVNKEGKAMHGWRVALLPYLGEAELYEKIRRNEPWDSEHNRQFHGKMPDVYRSPFSSPLMESDGKNIGTHYAAVVGEEAVFAGPNRWADFSRITDGTSNTILFVMRKTPVNWMDPNSDIPFELAAQGFQDDDREGLSGIYSMPDGKTASPVVLCDGSVHFLSSKLPKELFRTLLTCAGGEASYLGEYIVDPDPPEVKLYKLSNLRASTVLPILQTVFAGRENMRLTAEHSHNRILVMCRGSDHEAVRELIEKLDKDPTIEERKAEPEDSLAGFYHATISEGSFLKLQLIPVKPRLEGASQYRFALKQTEPGPFEERSAQMIGKATRLDQQLLVEFELSIDSENNIDETSEKTFVKIIDLENSPALLFPKDLFQSDSSVLFQKVKE